MKQKSMDRLQKWVAHFYCRREQLIFRI